MPHSDRWWGAPPFFSFGLKLWNNLVLLFCDKSARPKQKIAPSLFLWKNGYVKKLCFFLFVFFNSFIGFSAEAEHVLCEDLQRWVLSKMTTATIPRGTSAGLLHRWLLNESASKVLSQDGPVWLFVSDEEKKCSASFDIRQETLRWVISDQLKMIMPAADFLQFQALKGYILKQGRSSSRTIALDYFIKSEDDPELEAYRSAEFSSGVLTSFVTRLLHKLYYKKLTQDDMVWTPITKDVLGKIAPPDIALSWSVVRQKRFVDVASDSQGHSGKKLFLFIPNGCILQGRKVHISEITDAYRMVHYSLCYHKIKDVGAKALMQKYPFSPKAWKTCLNYEEGRAADLRRNRQQSVRPLS